MLDPVFFLGALGVVESFERSDQITRDTADAFEAEFSVMLFSSALGAALADDTAVTADRISVDRMVDRTVSDARLFHASHYLFERFEIVRGVAVKLHITDMSRIGERMERRLYLYLVVRADVVVHGHVEGVGVIIPVGHARYYAVLLLVYAHEPARKSFGGGRDKPEVEPRLLRHSVEIFSHEPHDIHTEVERLLALAVVFARQRYERFGKTDESDRQSAVFEHFADFVVGAELLGIDPHALSHEEREVLYSLFGLDLESVEQLLHDEIHLAFQFFEEPIHVALALDRYTRQIDGGEREIASSVSDLTRRIVYVAHDAGAAAHVRDLGLGMSRLVILQVERRVYEREVGEQPLRADLTGELEQIVVGILLVVVHSFLDLEYVDREDRRFAETESRLFREQYVPDDHPAFGRSVGAVVDGAERSLRSRAGMHRVEVVDKRFHSLVRRSVRLSVGVFLRKLLRLGEIGVGDILERFPLRFIVFGIARQAGIHALFVLYLFDDLLDVVHGKRTVVDQFQRLGKVGRVQLLVRLDDARRKTVVEIGDTLSAVLIVLVGLNGNTGERRVALDIVGLSQKAVPRRKPALEQFEQIDLTARSGERVEVEIVDMYIAFSVSLALFGRQDILRIIILRAFAAVFEHRAHRGVAVDVGVVALHVAVARVGKSEFVVNTHQRGVHLTRLGALCTVEDVLLGDIGVSVLHQDLFDHILDILDRRAVVRALVFVEKSFFDKPCQSGAFQFVLASRGRHGLADSGLDLGYVVRDSAPVSLDNRLEHTLLLPFAASHNILWSDGESHPVFCCLPNYDNTVHIHCQRLIENKINYF